MSKPTAFPVRGLTTVAMLSMLLWLATGVVSVRKLNGQQLIVSYSLHRRETTARSVDIHRDLLPPPLSEEIEAFSGPYAGARDGGAENGHGWR